MLSSLRNIASALLIISVLSLASSFAVVLTTGCSSPSDCAAAISLFRTDYANGKSTPPAPTSAFTFNSFIEVMQVVSAYGLLSSVTILIALEIAELHYLKLFFAPRRKKHR